MMHEFPVRWPLWACLLMLLAAPGTVLPAPPDARRNAEVRVPNPENYCLGGIEDRKVIVDESQLTNPFRQTTLLGCQVDGGDPQVMPDLPTPSPEQRRLV